MLQQLFITVQRTRLPMPFIVWVVAVPFRAISNYTFRGIFVQLLIANQKASIRMQRIFKLHFSRQDNLKQMEQFTYYYYHSDLKSHYENRATKTQIRCLTFKQNQILVRIFIFFRLKCCKIFDCQQLLKPRNVEHSFFVISVRPG